MAQPGIEKAREEEGTGDGADHLARAQQDDKPTVASISFAIREATPPHPGLRSLPPSTFHCGFSLLLEPVHQNQYFFFCPWANQGCYFYLYVVAFCFAPPCYPCATVKGSRQATASDRGPISIASSSTSTPYRVFPTPRAELSTLRWQGSTPAPDAKTLCCW